MALGRRECCRSLSIYCMPSAHGWKETPECGDDACASSDRAKGVQALVPTHPASSADAKRGSRETATSTSSSPSTSRPRRSAPESGPHVHSTPQLEHRARGARQRAARCNSIGVINDAPHSRRRHRRRTARDSDDLTATTRNESCDNATAAHGHEGASPTRFSRSSMEEAQCPPVSMKQF